MTLPPFFFVTCPVFPGYTLHPTARLRSAGTIATQAWLYTPLGARPPTPPSGRVSTKEGEGGFCVTTQKGGGCNFTKGVGGEMGNGKPSPPSLLAVGMKGCLRSVVCAGQKMTSSFLDVPVLMCAVEEEKSHFGSVMSNGR